MKKKLVSFGMAAMMAASLAACGGSKPAETTAAAGDAETTAAEGAETEAAAEGGTLKVGIIGPLTGAGAAYGNAVANGAELAAKEINEAGGINGMMIETKAEDDENDPEKSINAYNTLKDWGMQVLDGPTTSKPCIAVGAEAESDNMFLITPSGSAVECVATDNAFRVCFADPRVPLPLSILERTSWLPRSLSSMTALPSILLVFVRHLLLRQQTRVWRS